MKTKVFISSTYGDLINFRKSIIEFFESVDLKLLGMENFGSRKSPPLETCLVEIEKCDIYVGIIAYRYGSVDKESLKSFTRLEYERALELNKEILIYLMHEKALTCPAYVDTGETAEKLKEFKELLLSNHTVTYFKEPEQLTSRIYQDVKTIIPKSKLKLIRPRRLKAKVTRFHVGNIGWIAFVGYLNGKPYEIFTGYADDEYFPIPKSIESGSIIQVKSENMIAYDYQYIDRYGYENTLGGLSHEFNRQAKKYCDIINTLLQQDTELSTVNDVIDKMEVYEFESPSDWKKGVKVALNKK